MLPAYGRYIEAPNFVRTSREREHVFELVGNECLVSECHVPESPRLEFQMPPLSEWRSKTGDGEARLGIERERDPKKKSLPAR